MTGQSTRSIVSVYGSSTRTADDAEYTDACKLGELLGRAGATVACGGYGGVMEGVSCGASRVGAHVIGYTVVGWNSRVANSYLSEERPCADIYQRLRRLIDDSNALVALGGGLGTVAEVMLAWNNLYLRVIAPRPLIVVGSGWARVIDALSGHLEIGRRHLDLVTLCDSVDDVVAAPNARGIIA